MEPEQTTVTPGEQDLEPAQAQAAETGSAPESGEEFPATDEDQTKPDGVQARIDELTRKRREAERMAAEAAAEKEYYKNLAMSTPAPEPKEKKIDRYDYETDEDYLNAVAEDKVNKILSEREKTQREQALARQMETFNSKGRQKFDDWDIVMSTPAPMLKEETRLMLVNNPDLAYASFKDPSVISRIAMMNPVDAALELGRMEERMKRTKPKTKTAAPPPIQTVGPGASPGVKDTSKMKANDIVKMLKQEEASRRAG